MLLCVADLNPAAKLAPAAGTSLERYRLIEWLAFINSEIHKAFGPLFHPESSEELKKWAIGNLTKRLGWLNTSLGSKKFVTGENFTAADAYLFTVLNWTPRVKVDLSQWPNVKRYYADLATRPSVLAAMKAEKPIKSG